MRTLINKLMPKNKKVLSQAEMRVLIEKAQNGDIKARNKMVEHNVGLISKYAKIAKVCPTAIEYEDLFQEGILGLIRAIELFDLNKKNTFSTYASLWIQTYVMRYIDNYGRLIRLPIHLCEYIRKIKKKIRMKKRLTQKEEKFLEKHKHKEIFSINTHLDTIEAPRNESLDMIKSDLNLLVNLVQGSKRDKDIFKRRATGETLETIGKEFGLTRERVRQIDIEIRNNIDKIMVKEKK